MGYSRGFRDFFFCSATILLLIATTLYHIVSVANQCRFVLNYLSLRHLYDFGRCLFSVNGAGPYGRFTAIAFVVEVSVSDTFVWL